MHFQPMHRHFRWGFDAQLDGVTVNLQDANNNVVTYNNRLL